MPASATSRRDPEPLNLEAFEALADFVLRHEEVPEQAELSIALVDPDEMARLQGMYRGVDEPTDVLSFGCDDPCPVEGSEPITLGDVVIAPEIAAVQAGEQGVTVEDELNLLLVHGILHILGYRHDTDDRAAGMRERELELLTAWADVG